MTEDTPENRSEFYYHMESPAYHEAGHAIVGLVLGRRITGIYVFCDREGEEDTGGGGERHEVTYSPIDPKNAREICRLASGSWAGVLAEGYATRIGKLERQNKSKRQGCGADTYDEKTDFQTIHQCWKVCFARGYGTNEEVDLWEWRAGLESGRLLRRNWEALEAVREWLSGSYEMDPESISIALRQHELVDLSGKRFVVRAFKQGFARCIAKN